MPTNRNQKSKDIASAAVEILGISEMFSPVITEKVARRAIALGCLAAAREGLPVQRCLLYTSPSPRDRTRSRMPSSA